jgi:hypothetical protein
MQAQLISIGLSDEESAFVADLFDKNGVDREVVPDLDHEMLISMGVDKAALRAKVLRLKKVLEAQASSSTTSQLKQRWTKDAPFAEVCRILDEENAKNGVSQDGELRVGARVMRGKDWHWGEIDGGAGQEGVVTGFRDTAGRLHGENPGSDGRLGLARVKWANGAVQSFEMGFEDK